MMKKPATKFRIDLYIGKTTPLPDTAFSAKRGKRKSESATKEVIK